MFSLSLSLSQSLYVCVGRLLATLNHFSMIRRASRALTFHCSLPAFIKGRAHVPKFSGPRVLDGKPRNRQPIGSTNVYYPWEPTAQKTASIRRRAGEITEKENGGRFMILVIVINRLVGRPSLTSWALAHLSVLPETGCW